MVPKSKFNSHMPFVGSVFTPDRLNGWHFATRHDLAKIFQVYLFKMTNYLKKTSGDPQKIREFFFEKRRKKRGSMN